MSKGRRALKEGDIYARTLFLTRLLGNLLDYHLPHEGNGNTTDTMHHVVRAWHCGSREIGAIAAGVKVVAWCRSSVLLHRMIYLVRPCENAAFEIFDLRIPGLLQHLVRLRTAAAHLTMHDDVVRRADFIEAMWELAE